MDPEYLSAYGQIRSIYDVFVVRKSCGYCFPVVFPAPATCADVHDTVRRTFHLGTSSVALQTTGGVPLPDDAETSVRSFAASNNLRAHYGMPTPSTYLFQWEDGHAH